MLAIMVLSVNGFFPVSQRSELSGRRGDCVFGESGRLATGEGRVLPKDTRPSAVVRRPPCPAPARTVGRPPAGPPARIVAAPGHRPPTGVRNQVTNHPRRLGIPRRPVS